MKLTLLVLSFAFVSLSEAQSVELAHDKEISISNLYVYSNKEKIWNHGLLFQFIKSINTTKFGVGCGFEFINNDQIHYSFGPILSYKPIHELCLSAFPSIEYTDSIESGSSSFHLESSYEFEYREFNLGPVFEFAHNKEDDHVSIGIHAGYSF